MTFKFRAAKPLVVPVPVEDDRPVLPVPFTSRFPTIPIAGIVVGDHAPKDEFKRSALLFCNLQAWLSRVFSPMQAGLPEIDADPRVALDDAYSPTHRRCFPAPSRPAELERGVDLAGLAMASPYACYLTRNADDAFEWDLTGLHGFALHPGLRSPSARVEFTLDAGAPQLRATRIDSELGMAAPGDHDWDDAVRLALCSVTTHLSLVRHFCWIHLVCGGPLAIATRNNLPAPHPLRRLLQPHIYATQLGNEMVTIDQMTAGGDFETVFSFTHAGMCELFEATRGDFDLQAIDPDLDAARRGVADLPIGAPALENRRALMAVVRDHVARYLAIYFDSDAAVAADPGFARWLASLEVMVHRGVGELAGSPVTLDGATRVLSTMIYLATVEHEIVGSGLWDYQLWSDVQPVRVARSGDRLPVDVYQRLVNANFNLNVHRTPLMSDFSALALDSRGADAFRCFRTDLAELQRSMDTEAPMPWRIEPQRLKANINY
jgi:hypothetical protein